MLIFKKKVIHLKIMAIGPKSVVQKEPVDAVSLSVREFIREQYLNANN